MDETARVFSAGGMNNAVGTDPKPLSAARGSLAVPRCSYRRIIPRIIENSAVAQGGGRARPSTLRGLLEGETAYKYGLSLRDSIDREDVTDRKELLNRFPRLSILRFTNYPVLGEKLSIYRIDYQLTYENFMRRLQP
jgi:hypothetical protein